MISFIQSQAGIVILTLLSTTLFVLSWRTFFLRDNRRAAVFMLFAAGFLLRIVAASDGFLHAWDERYHALVAKNMQADPLKPTLYRHPVYDYDFKEWGSNHVWLHKPPLTLWIMSGSITVFGEHELAVRLPSILLSSFAILLLASVGGLLVEPRSAFLGALFFAINGPILDLVGGRAPVDHIDTHLLFWVLLGIWMGGLHLNHQKMRYLLGMGAATGCAVLTKSFPGLFVLGIWGIWALFTGRPLCKIFREGILACIVALLVFLPWNLWTQSQWPEIANWVTHYSILHLTEALEGHDHPWYYYLSQLGRRFSLGVYPVLAYFLLDVIRNRTAGKGILFVWILTPNLIFSFAATKMPAYATLSWPAVCLVVALVWWKWRDIYQSIPKNFRWKRMAWGAGVILLIVLPLQVTFERLKLHHGKERRHPEWAQQLKDMSHHVDAGKPTLLFNTDHPIEAMFYADLTAYPVLPAPEELNRFVKEGYQILLLKEGSVLTYPESQGGTASPPSN